MMYLCITLTDVRVAYFANSINQHFQVLQVSTVDDMWEYLRYSLVPSLYHEQTKYIVDGINFVVGSVRIRQLRIRQGIGWSQY